MSTKRTRRVTATGLELEVREASAWGQEKATVVLVHGYPDRQSVWDPVLAALPHDELHLVTYDVRGAGASDAPEHVRDYRTELLVSDLAAVVNAVVPHARPVHLVGHDWGSVQLWDAVNEHRTHPELAGRIASFTSISGPSLDHLAWLTRHPRGRIVPLLGQLARSWYAGAFQVPVLPDLAWRLVLRDRSRDAVNGLNLYRANLWAPSGDRGRLHTDVPVQLIHPRRDPFLSGVLLEGLEQEVPRHTRVDLDAGHWVIRSHAGQVADLILGHVRTHR